MIKEFELQAFLFEKETSRLDLINYAPTIAPSRRISVCRNHSFELIENTIKPYLEYAGLGVEFLYSSYDDSLSFLELDVTADMVILWLDLTNYKLPSLKNFIEQRITHLREIFTGNILFVPCGENIELSLESLQVERYDLSNLEAQLGDKFFDLRLEAFSGTKLSHLANIEISRDLGLNYLPALLTPNLKGIVVDLDNTLYKGVLGEDGVAGVLLTEGHRQLQTRLKGLSEQGFFVCIASKNDERDVAKLFEEREDFPLTMSDFVQIYANWGSKSDSISSIAEALNISTDSLLFIDDNIGELVSVLEVHPEINAIWAKDDASVTQHILSNYPGLLKLNFKKEDSLRKEDTIANRKRRVMQAALSKEGYIKGLNMQLVYNVDDLTHVDRVTELANKTNQFIFSYRRYSHQQVKTLMQSPEFAVVSVSLSDKLSDSGIIGVVVLKQQTHIDGQASAVLEECFVSCRALGRGIDEAIVLGAVSIALKALRAEKLSVDFTKGDRNLPAEQFCNKNLGSLIESPGDFTFELPTNLIEITINQKAVR